LKTRALATLGEAYLILGDINEAARYYRVVGKKGPDKPGPADPCLKK
jgi:TolA-binding protein